MPAIEVTFVQPDGVERVVEAEPGGSLMEAGRAASVAGILADCGGACACATCHVYVGFEWRELVGPANPVEDEMLDLAEARRDDSRLSCQVRIEQVLDGLRVRVAV